MIISDLCDEYSVLVSQNKAPAYGHDNINVPYGLVINDDGTLVAVRPLGDFSGKKPIHIISAPTRFPRSSGIVANFLCDTVTYMLGYDTKGKPERAAQAFQACAELHLCVLDGVEGPVASAICAFFTQAPQWETAQYLMGDEAWKSSLTMNFALYYDNGTQATFVGDFPNVQEAWNTYYDQEKNDNESTLVSSLVSGKQVVPEKIHPKIKGVAGAQSAGASLISFNAPAFCSHGAEQNENAPMSKREAYEYPYTRTIP
jgi:CRISPR-associated protein Csd1